MLNPHGNKKTARLRTVFLELHLLVKNRFERIRDWGDWSIIQ